MNQNKVFISHASSDYRENGKVIPGNAITEIMKVLENNGIDRWIDETGLISSKGWCRQIENAINECNIFLYVSSEKANSSPNTANEIAYAIEQKKHIIPFKIDNSDYHKDNRLNLIRIHYLRYYEDREKALKDLVSTIRCIKTDKIIIDTSVRINKTLNEKRINGSLISNRILSIFNKNEIKNSAELFNSILKDLNCNSENGYNTLNGYIERLKKLADERNYNVRRNRIERLISDMKEDSSSIERHVKIMYILLKMYLYYCLDDIKEVVIIQKEIKDVNFTLSYVEKNAETINDVANSVARTATFILSAAALLTGQGGSVAKGGLFASTHGEKVNIVKTSEKIKSLEDSFNALKAASLALDFWSS